METKPDWAQMAEDEDDDHQSPEQREQNQRQQTTQGEHTGTRTQDSRPPGTGTGTRGTGRGRGGRGGRGGDRGGRGGARGGHPGQTGQRRDNKDKVRENQPKPEMINLINRSHGDVLINLFNVDFNANEADVRSTFSEVTMGNIDRPKPGVYECEMKQSEALKLVEIGSRKINDREVYMRISFRNKQLRDDQWHVVGGGFDVDNLKEKREQKKFVKREGQEKKDEPVEMDPDNKFFKGRDVNAPQTFSLKFTNAAKKEEPIKEVAKEAAPKVAKANPFGAAVARDESEYLKARPEEQKTEEKPVEEKTEGADVKLPPGISAKAEDAQGGKGRFFNSTKEGQPVSNIISSKPAGSGKVKAQPGEKVVKKESAKGNLFQAFNAADDDDEEEEDN